MAARGVATPTRNRTLEKARLRGKSEGLPFSPQGGAPAAVGSEIGSARRRV
jgi:hypothetical protein